MTLLPFGSQFPRKALLPAFRPRTHPLQPLSCRKAAALSCEAPEGCGGEPAASGAEAGGGSARAPGARSSRARTDSLLQPLSRDFRSTLKASPPALARRKARSPPHLPRAVRGASSRALAGSGGLQAPKGQEQGEYAQENDLEMGAWHQQPVPQLSNL